MPAFKFSDDEIETLARTEHDRWTNERLRSGWAYAKKRDPEKRLSPYLVSWDVLENDIREYDREAIKALPAILAHAGFGVTRI